MTSNAEKKLETQEIEKFPENTNNEAPQDSSEILDSSKCEQTADSTESTKKEKKKRPISAVLHGSLKRHTPKFFPQKRQSESTVSLNENIRKSASDMWSDVKSVFRRLSLKKGKI